MALCTLDVSVGAVRWLTALFNPWTWRMAWRDSRSSRRRLLLFSSSISLGIAALVAIGSLGRNLQDAIQQQAKALLGADLVLASRQPFGNEAETLFQRLGGETARETSFSTMIVTTNGTRLVNARALAGGFPFYGEIETDPPGALRGLQQGGGVLVEESVLQQFDVHPGDRVKLGAASFRVLGTLLRVPGDSVSFASLAPRVYLHAGDLPATGLLKPGSLARYKAMFRLDPGTDVDALVKREKDVLQQLHLSDETVAERQRDLGNALQNLYRFLNLVAFIALILGAVGVASAIQVHIRQKLPNVAVLRCLGAPIPQTFAIYLAQGLGLGAAGTLAGILLGAIAAYQLPHTVRDFVPFAFETRFDWIGALLAALAGFWICLLFTLLPLLEVRRVSPLAAIRAAYEPTARRDPARWALGALIVAGLVAFSLNQTRRWQEGFGFAGGLIAAFLLLAGAGQLTMKLARRMTPTGLPFVWRQGLASLYRPHNRTTLLLVSIGLGTFLLLTLHLTRDVLLHQLFPPGDASRPNTILFDIQPDQRDGVHSLLADQNLPLLDEAPIVTMRLSAVKGVPVDQLAGNRTNGMPDWPLKREYRSTWRTRLNESERVRAGTFIGSITDHPESLRRSARGDELHPVSLEEGIARDLNVGVGDELVWDIQGVPFPSYVSSLREVDWRQVRPNFFAVFPEGSLEAAPAMLVMATRVQNSTEAARLQRTLVTAFPNISAIDLTLVLKTLDGVLTKVGFVIRFMALFTVFTGLLVLAGAVLTGRWQRVQESILLRTLGASRSQIREILFAEYASLGLLASLTASGLAVAGSWALATFVFESRFAVSALPIGIAVLAVTALTVAVGLLTSRGIADQPPLEILRRES